MSEGFGVCGGGRPGRGILRGRGRGAKAGPVRAGRGRTAGGCRMGPAAYRVAGSTVCGNRGRLVWIVAVAMCAAGVPGRQRFGFATGGASGGAVRVEGRARDVHGAGEGSAGVWAADGFRTAAVADCG